MEIFLNTTSSSDIMLSDKSIKYRKIPKISPRAYIFQRPFLRGLFLEGLIFGGAHLWREICVYKSIGLALYIVRSKFTVFTLYYFVFEGNFPSTIPRGAYIWKGDLMEGFLRHRFGELIYGGAYTWRGIFSKFYGNCLLYVDDLVIFSRSAKYLQIILNKQILI